MGRVLGKGGGGGEVTGMKLGKKGETNRHDKDDGISVEESGKWGVWKGDVEWSNGWEGRGIEGYKTAERE